MPIKDYVKLISFISQNNSWGKNMLQCIRRKRKCIKYISSTIDMRSGEVYQIRFNLGFNKYKDFTVHNTEDIQVIYKWLNEKQI